MIDSSLGKKECHDLVLGTETFVIHQLRARRMLTINNVLLRTRRGLSLYIGYEGSALLVPKGTLSNNFNAILAFRR